MILLCNMLRVDHLLRWCAKFFQSAVVCTYEQVSAIKNQSVMDMINTGALKLIVHSMALTHCMTLYDH